MRKIFLLFLFFAFFPLSAGQIIKQEVVDPGDENCPAGGIKVSVGEDLNTNTVLDENEVASYAYVCGGENGCNVIVKVSPSSSIQDSKCEKNSGIVISSGLDCNSDGNIDNDDTLSHDTELCYGSKGSNGSGSAEGGESEGGADGTNGKTTEFVITDEPAGDNCAAGGKKIENRFDANGNGEFEESEITVKYVCNGESLQGSKGEQGNQGVAGTDGKDGAKGAKGERGDKGEQGEAGIAGEAGETGADGYDSLISVVDEPAGANCTNGGKKFLNGFDTDRDGVLSESEVKSSYYVCNGEDAAEASETAASSGCSLTVF